jgi:alkylation response protein AidB-like acyl-CoA dehydrogenase
MTIKIGNIIRKYFVNPAHSIDLSILPTLTDWKRDRSNMIALTDQQRELVETTRELAEENFRENACEWEGETPWENIKVLAEHDLLGINMPEEYGGRGHPEIDAVLMTEAVGRVCPDTAYALIAQQMVGPRAIAMFGSEEAKARYLPPVIEGDAGITIAMSEPEAGSDMRSMITTITETDEGLRLNGEKTWVGGVPGATAAVVWVKFPDSLGTVIMDFDNEGVEIQREYTNMHGRTQTHFTIDDVLIPEENILTQGAEGFKQQLQALNWERLGSAALANATALCAFDKATAFAAEREQFDQSIGDFQGIEWKFADMAKQVQASRALTQEAAEYGDQHEEGPDRMDTSIAKLYSGEMLENVVSEALQIHGARGYQEGHPLEYLYRFARSRRIAAGTDEIQKNTIAHTLKQRGIPHLGDR